MNDYEWTVKMHDRSFSGRVQDIMKHRYGLDLNDYTRDGNPAECDARFEGDTPERWADDFARKYDLEDVNKWPYRGNPFDPNDEAAQ